MSDPESESSVVGGTTAAPPAMAPPAMAAGQLQAEPESASASTGIRLAACPHCHAPCPGSLEEHVQQCEDARLDMAIAQEAEPASCTLQLAPLISTRNKLRVLLLRANSPNPLRLDDEEKAIRAHLQPADVSDADARVVIKSLPSVTFSDVRAAMRTFKPHCVHYMGHGTSENLVLADDDGSAYGTADLAALFKEQSQCFLAVFNCCFSAEVAAAVSRDGCVHLAVGTSCQVCRSFCLPTFIPLPLYLSLSLPHISALAALLVFSSPTFREFSHPLSLS